MDIRKLIRRRKSKYRNTKFEKDGVLWDSKKEYYRYLFLREKEKQGKIHGLEIHPRYTLQEGFRTREGGRERAITFSLDFRYKTADSTIVVEDVKAKRKDGSPILTKPFRDKRKMLLSQQPDLVFKIILDVTEAPFCCEGQND